MSILSLRRIEQRAPESDGEFLITNLPVGSWEHPSFGRAALRLTEFGEQPIRNRSCAQRRKTFPHFASRNQWDGRFWLVSPFACIFAWIWDC